MVSRPIDIPDRQRLATYLEAHVDGFKGPLSARKFADGQSNPTFLLEAASGKYVLRSKPPGALLKSAHAVDREFRVLRALAKTDVPVPKVFHLCRDDSVVGSMFYVMSYEHGRVFWDPALPEIELGARAAYHRDLVRVLATLHDVDIHAVGLADFGKPGNYFERQTGRWSRQYRATQTGTVPAMETLMRRLPASIPADDGQVSLIHGDYRLDNAMFDADTPRVIAVLDWELSTLGHPYADIAYYCMCQRLPPSGIVRGLAGIDRVAVGVPDERDVIAQYCDLRGIAPIENWNFYLAFSFFRLAAICQGVERRALEGNASSARAREVGRMVAPLSDMALALVG